MKILVVFATAGAGHKKAAEALYEGLCARAGHEAFLVDVLEHTNGFYRSLYSRLYTLLISRLPWLWGFFFRVSDIPVLQPLIRVLRRLHNGVHAGRFQQYLIREQFDYVFSTHFFPNEVAAYLKRRGRISSCIVCAVTDFDVHRIWLADGIDRYTVASDWTKRKMSALGVPEERVTVTGIPVARKFSQPKDIPALRARCGLSEDLLTVLLATGSFGIGPIEEIIAQLAGIQVLVVCGHNRSLFQRLSGQKKELVKVFGLVDNMDELMAAADVMITKPGGLSISEALVCGLPLIFFSAIPGQESHNVQVLAEYGVGLSGCSISEMAAALKHFGDDREAYQAAREQTRTLARPQAVQDITQLIP